MRNFEFGESVQVFQRGRRRLDAVS